MKPRSIADYLDHLGRAAGEKAPPRPESSPFRPRSLPSPQNGKPALKPVFDRAAKADGVGEKQAEDAARRAPWVRKPLPLESPARQSPPAGEPVKARGRVDQTRRSLCARPRGGLGARAL
jgi:hypothetical protein